MAFVVLTVLCLFKYFKPFKPTNLLIVACFITLFALYNGFASLTRPGTSLYSRAADLLMMVATPVQAFFFVNYTKYLEL